MSNYIVDSPWGVRNLLKIYPRLHYFWLKYVKSLFGCWKRGYLNWFFDGNNAYQILILLVWIPTSIYEKKWIRIFSYFLSTDYVLIVKINLLNWIWACFFSMEWRKRWLCIGWLHFNLNKWRILPVRHEIQSTKEERDNLKLTHTWVKMKQDPSQLKITSNTIFPNTGGSRSPLSTLFGTWKKLYYVKFVLKPSWNKKGRKFF